MTQVSLLSTQNRLRLYSLFAVALLSACGGNDPPDNGDAGGAKSFFPVAVGNKWVYEEVNAGVIDTITKKITKKEQFEGDETFVQETTQTKHDIRKTTNLRIDGSRVTRVRQQTFENDALLGTNIYTPGFLRFDEALVSPGEVLRETHVREEYDADGKSTRKVTDTFTWLLEAVDAEVEVPAGKFTNCRQIRRLDVIGDETKRFYYAAGVGKVLEQIVTNSASTPPRYSDTPDEEALKSYSIKE